MKSVFTSLFVLSVSLVYLCTALICPAVDFNAYDDAAKLRDALNVNDEKTFTNILSLRTAEQREAILHAYSDAYQRDLILDSTYRLSGNFKDLVVAMLTRLPYFYANELFQESRAFGTATNAVVDILLTSSNDFIKELNDAYTHINEEHGFTLEKDLAERTFGLHVDVIMGQVQGVRDESQVVNMIDVIEDAKLIYELSKQKKDEHKIQHILKYRSFKCLKEIIAIYEQLYTQKIDDAVEWMSPKVATGAKYMSRYPQYFARRLYATMDGSGTDNRELIRIIVGRSEIDLDEIADAFHRLYKKRLTTMIVDDTSGNYRYLLMAIVNSKEQICTSIFCPQTRI